MRSPGAIRHKLNQVRYRYLKKRIDADLRPAPGNCTFNAPMGEDGHALCLFGAGDPQTWKPSFCDERLDGGVRAKSCSMFCARRTKEQVKDEFEAEFNTFTIADVAYRYPDMAALIWVLGEDSPEVPPAAGTEPASSTALAVEEPLPWWKRFLGQW